MAVAVAALSLNAAKDNLDGASCEILLDRGFRKAVFDPATTEEITGQVLIHSPAAVAYSNLWIQLEGTAISRFQSKFDGRVTNNYTAEHVLPTTKFYCVIFGTEEPCKSQKRAFKSGSHNFHFKILLRESSSDASSENNSSSYLFPMSFNSPYGEIQYRLAAYVSHSVSDERKMAAATQHLNCKGYRSFACGDVQEEDHHHHQQSFLQPVQVVRSREKTFSRKLISKATLSLDKQAFVRGDALKFTLNLENPARENVSKLKVELVGKTVYHGSPPKTTAVVLRKQERGVGQGENNNEICWTGDLLIPTNVMPSFTSVGKCIEIYYVLQFLVEANKKPLLKGETQVLIGTSDGSPKITHEDLDKTALSVFHLKSSSRRPSTETLAPYNKNRTSPTTEDSPQHKLQLNGFRPRSSSFTM